MDEKREALSLSKAAEYLLDECRMVLPGLQALFGFQLIAVFSAGFESKLSANQRLMHLAAIGLSAIAVAFIMTPAALHRQRGSTEVTESFIRISSRLLLCSMVPLALSISIDFYLVSRAITQQRLVLFTVGVLLIVFAVMWFVLPHNRRLQKLLASNFSRHSVRELDTSSRFPDSRAG